MNYLTIDQQFGREARGNHNGQRQVMSVSGQALLKESMMRVLLNAWVIIPSKPSCWIVVNGRCWSVMNGQVRRIFDYVEDGLSAIVSIAWSASMNMPIGAGKGGCTIVHSFCIWSIGLELFTWRYSGRRCTVSDGSWVRLVRVHQWLLVWESFHYEEDYQWRHHLKSEGLFCGYLICWVYSVHGLVERDLRWQCNLWYNL